VNSSKTMKAKHILYSIILSAACLLTSCASSVEHFVPAAAGTATGSILVDSNTSVATCSRIIPQGDGRWITGPEGIAIATQRGDFSPLSWGPSMDSQVPKAERRGRVSPPHKGGSKSHSPTSNRAVARLKQTPPEPSSEKLANNARTGSEVFP
jgi:hypothetical protein